MSFINSLKDILEIKNSCKITSARFDYLINKSTDPKSRAYLEDEYKVKNSPCQGIFWLGDDEKPKAVFVKTDEKSFTPKLYIEYPLKKRNGIIDKHKLENQVLLNQSEYGYPIFHFYFDILSNWVLTGKYEVAEIKESSVILRLKNEVIGYKNIKSEPPVSHINWSLPSDEELFQLAKIITKYIKFLSPDIVRLIVEENEKINSVVCKSLHDKGINPELYLWEKSSCCFPGIRKYNNPSEQILLGKKHSINVNTEDAIAIDKNYYLNQFLSFIVGESEFKNKPNEYVLCTLFDCKNNNRMAKEFEFEDNYSYKTPFYGLYTCASNLFLIPSNFVKLIDFDSPIRTLLYRRVRYLYGDFCNLIPPYATYKENSTPNWFIEYFYWPGTIGEAKNIKDFFDFRMTILSEMQLV